MTNLWHDIDRGAAEEFNVIVEIPKDSRVKYEVCKETGLIKFDRMLYSPMHYPGNYGFIPQTLWDDGDPLDVLIIMRAPLDPGCLVKCRPLGVLDMLDDGEGDAKIIAVPIADHQQRELKELEDIEKYTLEEIRHFFKVYKDLQNKKVEIKGWHGRERATEDMNKSFKLYDDKFRK